MNIPQHIENVDRHEEVGFHKKNLSKLDSIVTNTANIKLSADSVNLNVDEVEAKLDTINTTLSSGIGGLTLPTSLTGSGNLKVSLQELGNEGSERLNVDVGSTVAQLPTALTGEGNLKVSIQEDFTHNLSTSANQVTTNTKLQTLIDHNDGVETLLTGIDTAQDLTNGKLDTINTSLGDIATESTLQIISEEFTKCDTDNVVISGGVVLPASLTGGGNLKVCIQELGNEGSERLNVDVGNAIAQLPTALSGSGRLKIENDISGFATSANQTTINGTLGTINNQFRSQWSNGVGGGTALGPAVALLATQATLSDAETHLGNIDTGIDVLEACVGSDKVNVNISSGGFDGAITNTHLNELGTAINSAKVDVNISSGNISGFATSAKQDTQETSLNAIETEVKLGQTCEDKEVIDDDAINPETLSIAIDTESYDKVRFYGNTTTSSASLGGSDLLVFGSNSSSGTYYHLDQVGSFQATTLTISGGSAIHYIGLSCENVPRFLKIFNKNNSSTFTITKLRMVGSNKMVNV